LGKPSGELEADIRTERKYSHLLGKLLVKRAKQVAVQLDCVRQEEDLFAGCLLPKLFRACEVIAKSEGVFALFGIVGSVKPDLRFCLLVDQ
jgi:hypothetical protein